jgi:hypothetical protein
LDAHLILAEALRALFSAGSRMAIRMAMIPMTTSSSTKVNPREDLLIFLALGICQLPV